MQGPLSLVRNIPVIGSRLETVSWFGASITSKYTRSESPSSASDQKRSLENVFLEHLPCPVRLFWGDFKTLAYA